MLDEAELVEAAELVVVGTMEDVGVDDEVMLVGETEVEVDVVLDGGSVEVVEDEEVVMEEDDEAHVKVTVSKITGPYAPQVAFTV